MRSSSQRSDVLGIAALLVAFLCFRGIARAQEVNVRLACPDEVSISGDLTAEVLIDVGPSVLGAYTVAIIYDPSVFAVTSVSGGLTAEFAGPPVVNPADFPTGRTRMSAFNTSNLTEPTGVVSVAQVQFSVLDDSKESGSIGIEVVTLADIDGVRLEATTESCTVTFVEGTPSATFTEAMQSPTPSRTPTPSVPLPTVEPSQTPTRTEATRTPPNPTAAPCLGDCNGDRVVTADELVVAVNIALGRRSVDDCRAIDSVPDGEVAVNEIVGAVGTALEGCSENPTSTAGPFPTNTAVPQSTPSPTHPPNRPPVIGPIGIYRTFPGYEIRLPIGATDPDGDHLRFQADTLPQGAELDAISGVFRWTPDPDQVGPFYVDFTCTDDGDPPLDSFGRLVFQVSPLDECIIPVCEPAIGCTADLPELSVGCCPPDPPVRVDQATADCPQGQALFVGRNVNGFGRLQSCDRFRVINFLQSGAVVRFHVRLKCLNLDGPVQLHARMETSDRLLFDDVAELDLVEADDGFAEAYNVTFAVGGDPPYFDLEGAEANFVVTAMDEDGLAVTEALRLQLTFEQLPDLME